MHEGLQPGPRLCNSVLTLLARAIADNAFRATLLWKSFWRSPALRQQAEAVVRAAEEEKKKKKETEGYWCLSGRLPVDQVGRRLPMCWR